MQFSNNKKSKFQKRTTLFDLGKVTLIIIGLFSLLPGFAQNKPNPSNSEIRVSYLSHYFMEPGFRMGYLKRFGNSSGEEIKSKSFVLNPSIGMFSRPRYHASYIANLDLGIQMARPKKTKYHTLGIGYGYLAQNDVVTLKVDFQGKISKTRELSPFHLATIYWESGSRNTKSINWFYKISGGQKFSNEKEGAAVLLLNFGLRKNLNK